MNSIDLLNEFEEVRDCDFKGEHYSVRDNGAVFRHARIGKRLRKDDNRWTFGTPNATNGYMYIGGIVRIHQIVATAFFGERDTKKYVVDHKDSNRRNNRVENLHWLTRLENVLKNPATLKKVIMCCGSLEAFLENPSMLGKFANQDPNFSWMRTVSKEEGRQALKNMNEWAKQPIVEHKGKGMGEWIYQSLGFNPQMEVFNQSMQQMGTSKPQINTSPKVSSKPIEDTIAANSPINAAQKRWRTPSDFPLCPTKASDVIETYYNNLSKGQIFSKNQYGSSMILDFAMNENKTCIWVLSKNPDKGAVKPWAFASIVMKDGKFVHENLGSFFKEDGGLKYFTLAQGKTWTGGDCFDDYC